MKCEKVRDRIAETLLDHFDPARVNGYEFREAADAVLGLFETVTANTMGHALRCDSRHGDPCDCTAGESVMLRLRRPPTEGEIDA